MEQLNRKRGSAQRRVTQFRTYLSTFQQNVDNNVEITEQQIIELEQRFDKIGIARNEFEICQDEIEDLVADELVEETSQKRDEFDSAFFAATSQAQYLINKFRKPPATTVANDLLHVSNLTSDFNVRLPILSLPEFDGSYEKWSAFHDTFKTIIHEHRQITTIQKFQYLRSALTGDAV